MGVEVELAMSADNHDDATDTRGSTMATETYVPEEVPGVDGEGGKQVEDVAEEEPRVNSDESMELIATDIGKEMACVGYDGEEEKAAVQAEIASVDRVDAHDDANGSEQDAVEGQTKQDAGDSGGEEGGGDGAKQVQRVECKEISALQDGPEAEGSPRLKPAGSSQGAAAARSSLRVIDNSQLPLATQVVAERYVEEKECVDAVAAAQEMHDNSAMRKRILRPVTSHPEPPAKKLYQAGIARHGAPVASPSRSVVGVLAARLEANAVAGARSPSPRARTDAVRASTDKQQVRTDQPAKPNQAGSARHAAHVASPVRSPLGALAARLETKSVTPVRSRSPRARAAAGIASTEKQQERKVEPAGKAEAVITSPSACQMKPHSGTRARSVPGTQTCSEQRVESEASGSRRQGASPKPAVIQAQLEDLLNAKKKLMKDLAVTEDFIGAEDAKKVVKELQDLAEQLRAKIKVLADFVGKKDYAGAAAVLDDIQAIDVVMRTFYPERLPSEDAAASAGLIEPVGLDAPVAMEDSARASEVVPEEHLRATKKMMQELATMHDLKAAAVAHQDMKEIDALAEQLLAKNRMKEEFAAKENYTGAAAALEEVVATEEQIIGKFTSIAAQQLAVQKKTMDELEAKKDIKGAAAAYAKVSELEKRLSDLRSSCLPTAPAKLEACDLLENEIRLRAQMMNEFEAKDESAVVAAAQALAHVMKTQEEQLATKKKTLNELVSRQDYLGAAAAHAEVRDLQNCMSVLVERANATAPAQLQACDLVEKEICYKPQIRSELDSKNDVADAAAAQALAQEMKSQEVQLAATRKTLAELVAKEEFIGAAAAKTEVEELEKRLSVLAERANSTAAAKQVASDLLEKEFRSKGQVKNDLEAKNDVADAAAAQALAREMKSQEEHLAVTKNTLAELVAKEEFIGAAAAKTEVLELQKRLSVLVERVNSTAAAKQDASDLLEKEFRSKGQVKNDLVAKNDVADAAAAQALAREMKSQEEHLAATKKTLAELVAKEDFIGAAAAKTEVLELGKRLSVLAERANATSPAKLEACDLHEKEILSRTQMMNELASQGDFLAAAALKTEIGQLSKSRSATPTVTPSFPGRVAGTHSDPRGGRNVQRTTGSGTGPVNLENIRVLSSSKVTQVPAGRKGGKGGGKKAAGRKGGGKKGPDLAFEDFAAIYVGCITTGQIYHVLAYGDHVAKLRAFIALDIQPIVNAKNLERRPGKEELFCSDDTVISSCLEHSDRHGLARFTYDVREVTKHLATFEAGTQTPLGHFVDLVLRVDSVDQLSIQSGPNFGSFYLQISGVDMNGATVGPLRLWNHEEGDVQVQSICILRGLKVAPEKIWNGEKYVNDKDGAKQLDSDARTAIEDVSHIPEIATYFRWN